MGTHSGSRARIWGKIASELKGVRPVAKPVVFRPVAGNKRRSNELMRWGNVFACSNVNRSRAGRKSSKASRTSRSLASRSQALGYLASYFSLNSSSACSASFFVSASQMLWRSFFTLDKIKILKLSHAINSPEFGPIIIPMRASYRFNCSETRGRSIPS